jgi:hypothetical protein
MEQEAMRREAEYLRRMRGGLARRGMLGASRDRRSIEGTEGEDDLRGIETAAKTPWQPMPSLKQGLSLRVGQLTTPTSDLSTREVVRWGGSAGIRLVLRDNLRRVSYKQSRTVASTLG